MQLTREKSAPSASPEWLVFHRGVTVGPVGTDLLLRGVLHGRVPGSSWVRQTGWEDWRELGQIREVSALTRTLERRFDDATVHAATLRDGADAVAQANDAGEALLLALHAAAQATFATVGLAHRVRAPLLLPTTSCIFEAAPERLGEVLPWHDPAFALARTGRGHVSSVSPSLGRRGGIEHALSARLSPSAALCGVAMQPILIDGELHALLELGRSDHPFRRSDSQALADFAERVAPTLRRLLAQQ